MSKNHPEPSAGMSTDSGAERELVRAFEAGELPAPTSLDDPVIETYRRLLAYYPVRKPKRLIDAEFDSFQACAAQTGIPEATLAAAAARGCEALAGGRVRLRAFLQWHSERDPPPPTLAERLEHGRLQNAILRLELGRLRGRYIPIQDMRQLVSDARESVKRFFGALREAAPTFPGQSEAEIAQRIAREAQVLEAEAQRIEATIQAWVRKARKRKTAKSRP